MNNTNAFHLVAQQPWWARTTSLPIFTITLRHTKIGSTPLDKWSACRRDLYLVTHNIHKRQASMHPAGFQTHIPSKRAAADPRLRPGGHWDRLHRYTLWEECSFWMLRISGSYSNTVTVNYGAECGLLIWWDKHTRLQFTTILRIYIAVSKTGFSVYLEHCDLYPCSVVMVPSGVQYRHLYDGVTH